MELDIEAKMEERKVLVSLFFGKKFRRLMLIAED